ncbi:MAG TPA: PQQ-dependent sugar dehydrogenase [Opitutaceae bacterium]|nr:PQQ-dependent sugar dehydrogenase [Opitutaceae bacterium]
MFSGFSKPSSRLALAPAIFLLAATASLQLRAADSEGEGDAIKGKAFFQQSCALCHSVELTPNREVITGQGPNLLGIFGRKAATGVKFTYTKALQQSGLTWNAASLDRFLTNPPAAVPGTNMPIPVPNVDDRKNVIAYLATLKAPAGVAVTVGAEETETPATPAPTSESGDWQNAKPGVQYHIQVSDLPKNFATPSAGNSPRVVDRPEGAEPSAPSGFAVKLFASNLEGGRIIRVAPNGDIFIAETRGSRLRVIRAADGAESPSLNQIFLDHGLDRPFGLAFYPLGDNPQWLYIANNNSVVRVPYRNGDLQARGKLEVIVPKLSDTTGGHSTRDIAFSLDGKRLFISVGSGSNVADGIGKKTPDEIKEWEAEHGFGASWGSETNRADILVTDPEGKAPLKRFATGIRNGVGITVNPTTGELWTATNERDGLGDNLVPDYITHVQEGGYYGWPWYYLGNHEDPRRAGERPDLAGKAIVPDVLIQAHSAALELVFYPTKLTGPAAFPAEYRGDAFVALHGSWNRGLRTGYKVIRAHFDHGKAKGTYEDFLTGFVVNNRSVWGRPVGVAVAHDGALLVTDDGNGTLWRVAPTGK